MFGWEGKDGRKKYEGPSDGGYISKIGGILTFFGYQYFTFPPPLSFLPMVITSNLEIVHFYGKSFIVV